MTDTLFNPVAGLTLQRPPGVGRVFSVSQDHGDNNNNGLDPATAFHDVTEALTHCENWRNDYIYVLDSTDGERAYPVVVGVHAVHIIGISVPGPAQGMDITSFQGGMISNNHAMQTGDGTGSNPYRDTTTGGIGTCENGWGMNYSGQAVIAPATA